MFVAINLVGHKMNIVLNFLSPNKRVRHKSKIVLSSEQNISAQMCSRATTLNDDICLTLVKDFYWEHFEQEYLHEKMKMKF